MLIREWYNQDMAKNVSLSTLQKVGGHFKTVMEHRREVRRCCFACGLYYQGLTHDLSKYSVQEFGESVKYFQGWRSPYDAERELYGYAPGWLHHKGRNRHHWEYWYDMQKGAYRPIKMPYRYLVESCCDRIAASKVYLKEKYTPASPLEYFLSRPARNYMHPETAAGMEEILRDVAENGEEAAFARIREKLKKQSGHR